MENNNASEVANFTLGRYTVLVSRNLILDGEQEITITPKMLSVLIELAKNQGQTLSKDQIILSVWGTPHTSDMVLSRAISDLRKVFSDSARQQKVIETVSKQGYRLKENVIWLNAQSSQEATSYEISVSPLQLSSPSTTTVSSLNDERQEKPSKAHASKSSPSKIGVAIVIGLFLISAFFAYELLIPRESENKPPVVNMLTSDGKTKSYVRYSVDGKKIAYVVQNTSGRGSKIVLQTLANNQTVFINEATKKNDGANTTHYVFSPAFSPDGNFIAYKHYATKSCSIVVANLSNFSKQRLSSCPISKTHALDWSSDGKHLVSTVFNPIRNIESLTLINASDGEMSFLPEPEHKASGYLWPRFSPDNKNIAVVYFRPNDNLWTIGTVNIESGNFTEILASRNEVSQVIWDESGSTLYYLLVGGAEEGIWKTDLAHKTTNKILTLTSSSLDFDTNSQHFISIEREKSIGIWKTENKHGAVNSIAMFTHLTQTHTPTLSPDDSKLAFISTASNIDSLWLNTLTTNQSALLFQSSKNEKLSDISWSPDGKEILVTVLRDGNSKVVNINLELGEVTPWVGKNNRKKAKWSYDGKRLYWYEEIDKRWYVIEENLATKTQKKLLNQAISRFEILNGDQLYYQKIGTTSVTEKTLFSEKAQVVTDDKRLISSIQSFAWDAHLNKLYYLPYEKIDNLFWLQALDVKTGKSEALFPVVAGQLVDSGRHISVSKKGDFIFHTRVDKFRTEIAVITPSGI